jgi:predicted ArsR family transcriptional regulator
MTPMSEDDRFGSTAERLGTLADPVRRRLYRFVVEQGDPVGRDEAAAGVGVPRHTAKFHLDKLVSEGLLDVEFRRLHGRTGPGAGRPAKLYRRASAELELSLPERRYQLAGRLFAEAVTRAGDRHAPVSETIDEVSNETGRRLGHERRSTAHPTRRGDSSDVVDALVDCGYEPYRQGDTVLLRNCPFHALAQSYPELVCSMNLQLLTGLVEGMECPSLEPQLAPDGVHCCVRLVVGD